MKIHPLALLAGLVAGSVFTSILKKSAPPNTPEEPPPVVETEPRPPKAGKTLRTLDHDGHWWIVGHPHVHARVLVHHPDCPVEKEADHE